MKAVLLSARDGSISVAEIPPPVVQWGTVLIRNTYSLISAGTERATLETGASSLVGKARQRPDQVRQVLNTARQLGVVETYRMVQDRLDRPMTLGYSCAGEVIAVGEGVGDITPGMRVAAGGAGYASHAEIVAVPRNLVVPVPDGVEDRWAAFATVGAIALQGIHQAEAVPGSRVAVIGLGLVGQLTLRLLRAYGYDPVGVDQDSAAVDAARSSGFVAYRRETEDLPGTVARHWGGARADAVLVTAATSSTDPVELAGSLARDRATVVIVGDVKVAPPRASYYHKELSVRYSRSYGPGRYDPRFEESGQEYPEGYVPWTERRNLAEVLRLVPGLGLESLDPRVFAVEDAAEAYRVLNTERPRRRVALLLRYPGTAEVTEPPRRQGKPATWSPPAVDARIAAIGAGNFATKMLFPHLRRERGVSFSWVASARGLTAVQQSRRWGFRSVAESAEHGLASGDADCVMVLSRHDSHGRYAAEVLRRGVALYCEKPLGLSEQELEEVAAAWSRSGAPALAGFNRRFAPAVRDLRAALPEGVPLQVVYRVFAGRLPSDHWYFDHRQGGRLLGEVCHFIDTANFLVPGRPVSVTVTGVDSRDPVSAQSVTLQIAYADSSTASIVYGGLTPPGAPKEFIEVACDGVAARIEDFESLAVWKGGKKSESVYRGAPKGHAEEMRALRRLLQGEKVAEADFRLALWSSLVACRASAALTGSGRAGTTPTTPALAEALGCTPGAGEGGKPRGADRERAQVTHEEAVGTTGFSGT
ncbi:bi-domain-containing oxidoreductase [Streptomyces sp. RLB1-33]|uniref:bi-domain-containing oxidoreductase n=1 Tax=Streptomyces mirabilis TaxID=68239 RepID=UPI00143E4035|nr:MULTISPECIES: bi-domain-containing oxidoreductase [Streptomyces]QIY72676.1 Gfo/Idh/MocA family oxidoreductase [Streptomyces sp. RLB1-33]QUW80365.1 bi-domain-containing oxidoreductase [Streptomyces mirabilis]